MKNVTTTINFPESFFVTWNKFLCRALQELNSMDREVLKLKRQIDKGEKDAIKLLKLQKFKKNKVKR